MATIKIYNFLSVKQLKPLPRLAFGRMSVIGTSNQQSPIFDISATEQHNMFQLANTKRLYCHPRIFFQSSFTSTILKKFFTSP
jgi:hypothetical protein